MVEPTGHCPYLGLKQNRAIRFASPTPEHRCYVSGEPFEIPVDQASYCLSQNHMQCPLYMGLSLPTTNEIPTLIDGALLPPPAGLRSWFSSLSPRDRIIYAIMIGMLVLIIAIYIVAGLQAFLGQPSEQALGNITPSSAPVVQATVELPRATADTILPTPTDLPTSTPSPRPSEKPTQAPVIILPTQVPAQAATPNATIPPSAPPASSAPATNTPDQPRPTNTPEQSRPTSPPEPQPTNTLAQPRPTSPAEPRPTDIPPTRTPSRPSATARPTDVPVPPSPTRTPAPVISSEVLTLYFADTTGTLYVPVQRSVSIENNKIAEAAIRALIAGPRNGLGRLVLADAQLRSIVINKGTATVNFDRRPTGQGDDRGLYAMTLTLTHFSSIQRVQFQVQGQNIGIGGSSPVNRPVLNPINPQNLPNDPSQTSFLPLYFRSVDGSHDIRLIRMVPKTQQTAEATIRALLEGPQNYSYAVQRLIPETTELRGLRLERGTLIVDFTQPFSEASNRDGAVRSVVESLTTLPTISKVQLLVEGRSLGEFWGASYGQVYGRIAINPE